jgi:hypothetical protein
MQFRSHALWIRWVARGVVALGAGLGIFLAIGEPSKTNVSKGRDAQLEDGWIGDVARHLTAREYWASSNEKGLQAPNRRQDLRTYFESTGIRVHGRTAPGEPELLGLSLVGVGRGVELAAVPPGEVASHGPRVEIRRPGLVEWYLNGPEGLEQGFDVAQRPVGEGPLVLALGLSGGRAELVDSQVQIETDAGRDLVYDKLVVEDADGAPVEAHLQVPSATRIALVVHDRGAQYPLTIDPVLSNPADTQIDAADSGRNRALFGGSVAGAGDVNGDGYDDVIVGAEEYDSGLIKEGAAFIFHGSASGIASGDETSAATQIDGNQPGALLGTSVDGAGDVDGDGYADVIIGAIEYDEGGDINEGAAFIFLGSSSGISDGGPATADTELYSDQGAALFGATVAGAGDVDGDGYADVIVGAEEWTNGQFNEGAAFVFHGSSTGIPDGGPGTADSTLESNQGGARMGEVSGAGDVNGDGYDDVVLGAPEWAFGETDEGGAFVIHGSASGVPSGDAFTLAFPNGLLQSNQVGAAFGGAVSSAGDVDDDGYADVIIGSELWDATPLNDEGAAFIFYGSASGVAALGGSDPSSAGVTELEATQANSLFGGSVAGVGDVSGDGYDDVMVGAPHWGVIPEFREGAAFLFLGSPTGIADGSSGSADSQLGLDGNLGDSTLGSDVAGAGDVNGDNGVDVIIGAEEYDVAAGFNDDDGAVFIFHGVPEPTHLVLLVSGIAGLLALGRNRIQP